jgi:hypothetical protein
MLLSFCATYLTNVQEDEDKEDEGDDDESASIEQKFLQIVQNTKLSHLETAALRLAIARDDQGVRDAIEAFRATLNEDRLMAALLNIARRTIQDTMNEQQQSNDDEGEEEGDNDDDDDDDDDEQENPYVVVNNRQSPAKTSSSPVKTGASPAKTSASPAKGASPSAAASVPQYQEYDYASSEEDDDDNEEEEDDGDDDDDEDDGDDSQDDGAAAAAAALSSNGRSPSKSLLTSQAARDHVFPILISELTKESIISREDGAAILKLFARGSPVINAALDVYDLNNDMGDLVETLQQVVDNSRG